VQVDPIKPVLKAPCSKRLKPKHDGPLSLFAFKFNLRRSTKGGSSAAAAAAAAAAAMATSAAAEEGVPEHVRLLLEAQVGG